MCENDQSAELNREGDGRTAPGGGAPRSERQLHRMGVAVMFITVHHQAAIPAEFEGVTRLQELVELRAMVGALARALGQSG